MRGELAPGRIGINLVVMNDDEREDRETILLNIIQNPRHRQGAWHQAKALRSDDDPEIRPSDLVAATSYVRTCMDNLRFTELQSRYDDDFVALWARGTVGQAKRRGQKQRKR